MALIFTIPEPFVSVREFARRTGQTKNAVYSQISKGQLPTHVLPQSASQKDPSSTKRKRFIDMTALHLDALKRNGVKING